MSGPAWLPKDAVWHSAAEVNWALSYEELRLCSLELFWPDERV